MMLMLYDDEGDEVFVFREFSLIGFKFMIFILKLYLIFSKLDKVY